MNASNQSIVYDAIRSLLFVPALNDKFIDSAHTREAQAIILDLEDSITYDKKSEARLALGQAVQRIRMASLPVFVRVNNDSKLLEDDLRAAVLAKADAIMLPKVDTADMVRQAEAWIEAFERQAGMALGTVKILALIETPLGMFNLRDTVQSSPRLVGLGFGSEDYVACLGIEPTFEALSVPAQQLAMMARAFGLAALGIPGSIGDFKDTEGFLKLVRQAKAYGFTGTPCIHPKQVLATNEGFRPNAAEIEHARRVLEVYEIAQARGDGAVALDGKMIDLPIVERARRTLEAVS